MCLSSYVQYLLWLTGQKADFISSKYICKDLEIVRRHLLLYPKLVDMQQKIDNISLINPNQQVAHQKCPWQRNVAALTETNSHRSHLLLGRLPLNILFSISHLITLQPTKAINTYPRRVTLGIVFLLHMCVTPI